jgi:hypothetical protein
MQRWRVVPRIASIGAALAAGCLAQTPDRVVWLKVGVEFRGRVESNALFEAPSPDSVYLNRLRLHVAVQPRPWLRFFVEGQDARAFSPGAARDPEDLRDTVDLRQAYVELGLPEQGWRMTFGRQELAIGDERLVGADSYWDYFGQVFDAVRLGYAGKRFRAGAFAGFQVQPARWRFDPHDRAERIAGLTVRFHGVEPYLLWRRGGGPSGHRDVLTPGLLAQGGLPHHLDYNVEMALQRGHVSEDGISAWAGHWELGWKPRGSESGPRVALEYNYASGDSDPADGTHGVFDDQYSANYNDFGMLDPILWRNIRYPGAGLEIPITKHWTISGGYRRYWLATVRDGLYPGGDEYLVRNPDATSSYVGSHALVSATYERSERWRVNAGYGRLFPGAYLRQSGYPRALKTVHAGFSFTL